MQNIYHQSCVFYFKNKKMLSQTEENYLKEVYKLMEAEQSSVSTNAIAQRMNTAAASVTDMVKRLSEKKLLNYERYKGVKLSDEGNQMAKQLIRKHRLWEVFLLKSLHFAWDEVHDIAEQLEHIKSEELINRLDAFLEFPRFDPHGDPIPDQNGNYEIRKQLLINELKTNQLATVVGVNEHATSFLQYLDKIGIQIGTVIKVIETYDFDQSRLIEFENKKQVMLSGKVSESIFVKI